MRRYAEPAGGPTVPGWLKPLLSSIRDALKDEFDWPLKLWKRATADLPTPGVAENEGAILYDSTANRPTYSDGASWIGLQAYDATLAALAAYNTNGLVTQTAADTFTGRAIAGTANEITVANGDGVAGNPTISVPTAITWTGKTVTGGTFNVTSVTTAGFSSTAGTSTFNPSSGNANVNINAPTGTNAFMRLQINSANVVQWRTNGASQGLLDCDDLRFRALSGTERMKLDSGGLTIASGFTLTVTSDLTVNGNTALGNASGDTTTITGSATISNGLAVTGTLSCTGNASLGDASGDVCAITGSATISNGLAVTGASTATTILKAGSFTVATLPSAATSGAGAHAYASNGRKAGEGGGAGTGIPVWSDASNWKTYYDNTTAAA